MKKSLVALTITFCLAASALYANEKPAHDKSVVVLSIKRDVFYFKIDKEYLGGVVEVYNCNGILTGSEALNERRMLIDFFEVPSGQYLIRVKKGDQQKEFSYVKE